MKSFNILLTCSSNKTQLIEWTKKSISKLSCKIKVFAGDTNSNVQSKYFCDKFWHMPTCNKKNYSKILRYCKKNKIKIIIPSSDKELKFWSHFRDNLRKNQIFVMISEPNTVSTCLDKLKFYKKLNDFDFIVFTSKNINDFNKKQTLIRKNRYGIGSRNIVVGKKEEFIDKKLVNNNYKNQIFQKYINFKNEVSIDCYFSEKNKLLKIVPRTRSLIIQGESAITTVINDKLFFYKIELIASRLKFTGHIMFQCFIHKRKVLIFECNPRIGGGSIMSSYNNMDTIYFFIIESLFPELNLKIQRKIFTNSKLLIYKNNKFFK